MDTKHHKLGIQLVCYILPGPMAFLYPRVHFLARREIRTNKYDKYDRSLCVTGICIITH